MPGYSPDVLDDLRQGNDIADVVSRYVQLKQAGTDYKGLCPFHREKTPSFSVSTQKQMFYCYGCSAGGDVFTFVMKIENLGFMDAIKFLADRIHYTLPQLDRRGAATAAEKTRMYEVYKAAARFYYDMLQGPEGAKATAYLDGRRVVPGVRKKFGLGYSPGGGALKNHLNGLGYDDKLLEDAGLILESKTGKGYFDRFWGRLMFPIFDVTGKVIGFGGRVIDEGEPKYLNSPETPVFNKSRTLYGLNYARLAKSDSIILVEGYMDVIALYQYGIKNVAAALGTSFTQGHAGLLKRFKEAIILFDGDEAGVRAALRAIPYLYSAGLSVKVAALPDAKDPDEFLARFGPKNFMAELAVAMDFVEFQVDIAARKYNLEVAAQRVSFLKEAAEIIGKLDSSIEQEVYLRELSAKYQMNQGAVKDEILKQKNDEPAFPADFRPRGAIAPARAHHDAIAHILYSMATDPVLYEKITDHLTAHELIEPLYIKLYNAISRARARGRDVVPADAISALESLEEQEKAANIFFNIAGYENINQQYNALGQQIKLVKTAWLDSQLAAALDEKQLNELFFAKKQLEGSKITLN